MIISSGVRRCERMMRYTLIMLFAGGCLQQIGCSENSTATNQPIHSVQIRETRILVLEVSMVGLKDKDAMRVIEALASKHSLPAKGLIQDKMFPKETYAFSTDNRAVDSA